MVQKLLLVAFVAVTVSACASTCEQPAVHTPVYSCENCEWKEN